jgi:hypothetical protein
MSLVKAELRTPISRPLDGGCTYASTAHICPFHPVVIMVCIEAAPTVDLYLFVPGPLGVGSWAWAEHPRWPGVLASEYCYSAREASALVRSYACNMSRQIRPREAERYIVLARGRTTGLVVARDQWEWAGSGYAPHGEPWNVWRQVARQYYAITGVRIESQRFRPRLG